MRTHIRNWLRRDSVTVQRARARLRRPTERVVSGIAIRPLDLAAPSKRAVWPAGERFVQNANPSKQAALRIPGTYQSLGHERMEHGCMERERMER